MPVGGRIPVTVTALRLDDFEGPIEVAIEDLPAGLSATRGVIEPGQVSTTLLLSADENAHLEQAAPLRVSGKAKEGARQLAHWASPEDKLKLIALMPKPDITMEAKTREVVLEPGKTATVEVEIQRNNDFGGRVPVEVYNLPPGDRHRRRAQRRIDPRKRQPRHFHLAGAPQRRAHGPAHRAIW